MEAPKMKGTYIGIDVGTSGMKLLLINERKEILAQSHLEYELSHPRENWSEIDPNIWYESAVEGLRRLLKDQDPSQVRVIGVTGQMHTLVLLGEDGQSIRPAMMWNDKRTADCIPVLREALAGEPDGAYLSGIVSTGSPAANLYWVSRHEPDVFAQCRHFLIGPDYLVYRLTGVISTEYVEASTSSLYCISNRTWSEKIRKLIGLPVSAYPPVRGSAETVGNLKPELAKALGLGEDVRIIAGVGDNAATAVSTGCIGCIVVGNIRRTGLPGAINGAGDARQGNALLCRWTQLPASGSGRRSEHRRERELVASQGPWAPELRNHGCRCRRIRDSPVAGLVLSAY